MPSFSLPDRIAALSPRERRVLVLLAEALPVEEISVAMGVSPQQVAGVRQALRRKLAVPPGVRLGDFIHQTPDLLPLAQAETQAAQLFGDQHRQHQHKDAERRRQLLLRRTIQEIETLIDRARARADALGGMASPSDRDDTDAGAGDEADHLRNIADELLRVRREVLSRVRRG
jgi:hypothetical protein